MAKIKLEGMIHAETENAVLFSTSGEEPDAAWLPLSKVSIDRDGAPIVNITMTENLAIDKELV